MLVAPAAFELIRLVREQDVEAGQRSVAAADVALKFHFVGLGQIRGVDLLLERPQAVPQHDHLMKERLDRPALLLHSRRTRTQDEHAASPFIGRHGGGDAGLFSDNSPQQHLEIRWSVARVHGCCPLAIADDGKRRLAGWRTARVAYGRGRCRRSRGLETRAAAVVVFAVTEAADHAKGRAVCVDDDHRVQTIGFACAAEVFEGFAGSIDARHERSVAARLPHVMWPAFVLVAALLIGSAWSSSDGRRKLLARLRRNWGHPRSERPDTEGIADFFLSHPSEDAVDDRTWTDLLMDD